MKSRKLKLKLKSNRKSKKRGGQEVEQNITQDDLKQELKSNITPVLTYNNIKKIDNTEKININGIDYSINDLKKDNQGYLYNKNNVEIGKLILSDESEKFLNKIEDKNKNEELLLNIKGIKNEENEKNDDMIKLVENIEEDKKEEEKKEKELLEEINNDGLIWNPFNLDKKSLREPIWSPFSEKDTGCKCEKEDEDDYVYEEPDELDDYDEEKNMRELSEQRETLKNISFTFSKMADESNFKGPLVLPPGEIFESIKSLTEENDEENRELTEKILANERGIETNDDEKEISRDSII